MQVYIGQARGAKMIARLTQFGFGECTCRGELPPRRRPWFYDNGAFGDWKAGRPFDRAKFEADVVRIGTDPAPDFLVLPDLVAGGIDSLRVSMEWLPFVSGVAPLFLAVQDGMSPADVEPILTEVDGVFVGGTLPWKIRTGAQWVTFAHKHGRPCHIGRCGGANRVKWARRIGANSIDSSLPLWSEANLARFVRALHSTQQELFA